MSDKPNGVLTTKSKVIFTVNDFDANRETIYRSEDFTIGSNLWQIIIDTNYKNMFAMNCNKEPMFAIELKSKSKSNLFVRFDSNIYDLNMKKKYSYFGKKFYDLSLYWDISNQMITTRHFMAQTDILVLNKRLIIGLNIIVESKDVYECIPTIISHRKSFNVKEFNDLHIVCGDKEFFVCKAILTSHSEVFQRMFFNETKEQITNQLIIEDFDGQVFEEFLKFIYFGNSDKLEELSEELLIIADKYQVLDLKKICENLMFIEICELNAIQLLITFDKYNCIEMTENSIEYISKNLWKIKRKTPNQWIDLMNNKQLLDRISEKMAQLIKNGLIGDQMINDCIKSYTYSYIN